MSINKRAFSLFELLVVMALVSITLGTLALQAPKLLRNERFERGVDQVKARIALAGEVMLNYQTDVELSLEPTDKGLMCTIEATVLLPEKLKRALNRNSLIQGIENASFEGEKALLCFDGTVGASPKGRLRLTGQKREAVLTLRGFTSPIQRGDHVATEVRPASYPKTILSFI